MPIDGVEPQSSQKRSAIETKLITQLESEISGLLGSIKVQASSIKETLKKQKSVMIEDHGGETDQLMLLDSSNSLAIDLDDVKIDVSDMNDSKLDESMNSVIRVDDDA